MRICKFDLVYPSLYNYYLFSTSSFYPDNTPKGVTQSRIDDFEEVSQLDAAEEDVFTNEQAKMLDALVKIIDLNLK